MYDASKGPPPSGYRPFKYFLYFLAVLATIAFVIGASIFTFVAVKKFAPVLLIIGIFIFICVWADRNAPKDKGS